MLQGLLTLPGLPGSAGTAAELLLRGTVLAALGLWSAPPLLRCYGPLAQPMLAKPGTDELNRRITHLTQTRAETIDASAAEIRRIERDLHDGAQARLVAIGMALDAAEHLLGTQPDTARELLRDARGTSAQALAELRGLVRGIHPPVLADRGLTDAVRALALEAPLPASVHSDLTGRLPAPAESAAYFTVSELLANVAKHAHATSASVRIRTGERLLTITVADDGYGGADLSSRHRAARPPAPPRRLRRHAHHRQPPGRTDRDHPGAAMRVVIAEDQFLLRDGLIRLLSALRTPETLVDALLRQKGNSDDGRPRYHPVSAARRGCGRPDRMTAPGTF